MFLARRNDFHIWSIPGLEKCFTVYNDIIFQIVKLHSLINFDQLFVKACSYPLQTITAIQSHFSVATQSNPCITPYHIALHKIIQALHPSSPLLKRPRLNHNHNNQTRYHQCKGDKSNQRYAPSASRELPSYDPMLRLEIPVETNEQHHDADGQEGGP